MGASVHFVRARPDFRLRRQTAKVPTQNTVEAPPFINPSEISAVSDAALSAQQNRGAPGRRPAAVRQNVPDHAKGDVAMQYKVFFA